MQPQRPNRRTGPQPIQSRHTLLGHRGAVRRPAGRYGRDRLDYTYYAGEDLRVAAALPVKDLAPRFPGGLQVFELTVQRNPTDANARFLLALLYRNAGRVSEAREALQTALKLRPGFSDVEALLAKLGPAPAPMRKIRPVESEPAPDATAGAVAAATSPREIAALALRIAASGDIGGAMSYFTPAKFPQEKQEAAVREAYIELRLRRVVALAAAKQCAATIQGLTNL